MFHANAFAGMRIRPAGNVACGKNVGVAALEARIDEHAAIQTKTSGLGEVKPRLNADANDHNLRVNPLASLQDNLLVLDPDDLRPEMKAHPLLGMSLQNQIGQFSSKHFLERMLFRRNDVQRKARGRPTRLPPPWR
jgi:hypothetical protein